MLWDSEKNQVRPLSIPDLSFVPDGLSESAPLGFNARVI
jgi:hypothetical protein